MRVLNASDDEEGRLLMAKKNRITDIIFEILSWNPKDFEFKNPEDFLTDQNTNFSSIDSFMNRYNKVQMAANADYLLAELYRLEGERTFLPSVHNEINARLQFYKALAEEYDNRLDLMSNPYYALLLEEDTARFKNGGDITELIRDRDIPGVDSRLESSQSFRDYVDALSYKYEIRREDAHNTIKDPRGNLMGKGGIFTRGTDTGKLLKWYRRRFGASAVFDDSEVKSQRVMSRISVREDKAYLEENLRKH
jgi:hypothetical protein